MFLGNIVRLKENCARPSDPEVNSWIKTAKKEKWIWLVVGIDDESLDYEIRVICKDPEFNMTGLGGRLVVLFDEIEEVEVTRKDVFRIMNEMLEN